MLLSLPWLVGSSGLNYKLPAASSYLHDPKYGYYSPRQLLLMRLVEPVKEGILAGGMEGVRESEASREVGGL